MIIRAARKWTNSLGLQFSFGSCSGDRSRNQPFHHFTQRYLGFSTILRRALEASLPPGFYRLSLFAWVVSGPWNRLYRVLGPENSGKISLRIESLLIRLLGWKWIRSGLDFFSILRHLPANSDMVFLLTSCLPSLSLKPLPSLFEKRQEPASPGSSIPPAVACFFFFFFRF